MATSGTTTYSPTAETVITQALRIIGVIEEGGSASASQLSDCLPAFEMLVKALQAEGLNLWTITRESITLVDETASYTTTEKALKLTDVVYRSSSGSDTIMIPLTRNEYWELNDKTDEGTQPTQYYFDPQRSTSTIYVWPVPDATAATGTLEVVYQSQIEDISDTSNNIDFPSEWFEPVTYQLAVRLAPRYGYPSQERYVLMKEAKELLDRVLSWDTEQESIYLRPSREMEWRK